jgi:hypothetical protein
MKHDWNSYICNVNGSVASIFLNLALHDEAPIPDNRWLLWVWLYLRHPRLDGLSDGVELDRLVEIESKLSELMLLNCNAILSGSITNLGRREFYYYGQLREPFESSVQSALAEFDEYKFETGVQEDPQWKQYLTVLYPSDTELRRIRIRNVQ